MNIEQIYNLDRKEKTIKQDLNYIKKQYDPEYETEIVFILKNT